MFLSSSLCLASAMYHPHLCSSKFSSLTALWYCDMLQVSLFKRMFFLIDLWVVDRHSQNIRGCWLKKTIVPFVCVIVTQVVIFGVNCGLNPVDLKTRTQPLRRVTSDSSFPAFCPRTPRRGWVRGSAGLNLLRPTSRCSCCSLCYAMVSLLFQHWISEQHRGTNRCTLRLGWNYWTHFPWERTLIQIWREVDRAGRLAY